VPSLGLTVWDVRRSVVVSVTGQVDIATVPQFSKALRVALGSGTARRVCDLTRVSFLDASCLRALLNGRRQALARKAWLDVVCTQSMPRKVIRLTGVDTELFPATTAWPRRSMPKSGVPPVQETADVEFALAVGRCLREEMNSDRHRSPI